MHPHKQGDTWDAKTFTINQDLTGCAIEVDFWMKSGQHTKRFNTADGTIVVVSAGAVSAFQLQSFQCEMPVGIHAGELRITYPGGRKKTRLNINWEIIE